MKIHTKKKLFRSMIQDLARKDHANLADGRMVARSMLTDNSMKRDFSPQTSGKGRGK